MTRELRVRLEHIGMAPSIIKKHEARILKKIQYLRDKNSNQDTQILEDQRNAFINYRRWDIRNEARSTHLAVGYLDGMDYDAMEVGCDVGKRDRHILPKVVAVINRMSDPDCTLDDVKEWIGGYDFPELT